MTLPNFTQAGSKESSLNETDVVPQSGAVSAHSIAVDEPKTQAEKVTVEHEPVLDSPEKKLEERKLGLDHREKELEKRKLAIDDRERKVQVETQMKIEGIERRERELEKRREEFEKERENWPNMPEWKASLKAWLDGNLALLPVA